MTEKRGYNCYFCSSASQKTHQILTLALMQFVNYNKVKSDSVETMTSVPHSNMQMSLWGKGSGWRHCSADSAAFHTLRPQMHVVHKYNWEATEDRRCARAKWKRITLSLVSEQFRMPLISWISCHPTSHIIKQSPLACRHCVLSELGGKSTILQGGEYDEYLMQHLTTHWE